MALLGISVHRPWVDHPYTNRGTYVNQYSRANQYTNISGWSSIVSPGPGPLPASHLGGKPGGRLRRKKRKQKSKTTRVRSVDMLRRSAENLPPGNQPLRIMGKEQSPMRSLTRSRSPRRARTPQPKRHKPEKKIPEQREPSAKRLKKMPQPKPPHLQHVVERPKSVITHFTREKSPLGERNPEYVADIKAKEKARAEAYQAERAKQQEAADKFMEEARDDPEQAAKDRKRMEEKKQRDRAALDALLSGDAPAVPVETKKREVRRRSRTLSRSPIRQTQPKREAERERVRSVRARPDYTDEMYQKDLQRVQEKRAATQKAVYTKEMYEQDKKIVAANRAAIKKAIAQGVSKRKLPQPVTMEQLREKRLRAYSAGMKKMGDPPKRPVAKIEPVKEEKQKQKGRQRPETLAAQQRMQRMAKIMGSKPTPDPKVKRADLKPEPVVAEPPAAPVPTKPIEPMMQKKPRVPIATRSPSPGFDAGVEILASDDEAAESEPEGVELQSEEELDPEPEKRAEVEPIAAAQVEEIRAESPAQLEQLEVPEPAPELQRQEAPLLPPAVHQQVEPVAELQPNVMEAGVRQDLLADDPTLVPAPERQPIQNPLRDLPKQKPVTEKTLRVGAPAQEIATAEIAEAPAFEPINLPKQEPMKEKTLRVGAPPEEIAETEIAEAPAFQPINLPKQEPVKEKTLRVRTPAEEIAEAEMTEAPALQPINVPNLAAEVPPAPPAIDPAAAQLMEPRPPRPTVDTPQFADVSHLGFTVSRPIAHLPKPPKKLKDMRETGMVATKEERERGKPYGELELMEQEEIKARERQWAQNVAQQGRPQNWIGVAMPHPSQAQAEPIMAPTVEDTHMAQVDGSFSTRPGNNVPSGFNIQHRPQNPVYTQYREQADTPALPDHMSADEATTVRTNLSAPPSPARGTVGSRTRTPSPAPPSVIGAASVDTASDDAWSVGATQRTPTPQVTQRTPTPQLPDVPQLDVKTERVKQQAMMGHRLDPIPPRTKTLQLPHDAAPDHPNFPITNVDDPGFAEDFKLKREIIRPPKPEFDIADLPITNIDDPGFAADYDKRQKAKAKKLGDTGVEEKVAETGPTQTLPAQNPFRSPTPQAIAPEARPTPTLPAQNPLRSPTPQVIAPEPGLTAPVPTQSPMRSPPPPEYLQDIASVGVRPTDQLFRPISPQQAAQNIFNPPPQTYRPALPKATGEFASPTPEQQANVQRPTPFRPGTVFSVAENEPILQPDAPQREEQRPVLKPDQVAPQPAGAQPAAKPAQGFRPVRPGLRPGLRPGQRPAAAAQQPGLGQRPAQRPGQRPAAAAQRPGLGQRATQRPAVRPGSAPPDTEEKMQIAMDPPPGPPDDDDPDGGGGGGGGGGKKPGRKKKKKEDKKAGGGPSSDSKSGSQSASKSGDSKSGSQSASKSGDSAATLRQVINIGKGTGPGSGAGGGPVYIGGGGSGAAASSSSGAAGAGGGRDDLWWKEALLELLRKQKESKKPKGKSKKNALKDAKRIYAEAKKKVKKAIAEKKKLENKAAAAKIKQLPKGQRKEARAKFKAAQKAKYAKILKTMPSTKGLTVPTINTLAKRMKNIRL